MVSRAELDSIEGTHARQTPRRVLSDYAAEVPRAHRLRLTESEVAPVTYLAVTGSQKPLLMLHRYLTQRPVDWDREAKEPSEDRGTNFRRVFVALPSRSLSASATGSSTTLPGLGW